VIVDGGGDPEVDAGDDEPGGGEEEGELEGGALEVLGVDGGRSPCRQGDQDESQWRSEGFGLGEQVDDGDGGSAGGEEEGGREGVAGMEVGVLMPNEVEEPGRG